MFIDMLYNNVFGHCPSNDVAVIHPTTYGPVPANTPLNKCAKAKPIPVSLELTDDIKLLIRSIIREELETSLKNK